MTMTIPSDYLVQGSTHFFVLRVTSYYGGSAEAEVEVFKSTQELPALKVCCCEVLVLFLAVPVLAAFEAPDYSPY